MQYNLSHINVLCTSCHLFTENDCWLCLMALTLHLPFNSIPAVLSGIQVCRLFWQWQCRPCAPSSTHTLIDLFDKLCHVISGKWLSPTSYTRNHTTGSIYWGNELRDLQQTQRWRTKLENYFHTGWVFELITLVTSFTVFNESVVKHFSLGTLLIS